MGMEIRSEQPVIVDVFIIIGFEVLIDRKADYYDG